MRDRKNQRSLTVLRLAYFGMLLRNSKYAKRMTYDFVLETAAEAKGADRSGYREEFLGLVKAAKRLKGK